MQTNIKQGNEQDKMTVEAPGQIYVKQNYTYVTFTEKLEGLGDVKTVLKVAADEVTVMRKGPIEMRQVFQYGTVTEGAYDTPYGKLKTEAKTDHIEVKWQEEAAAHERKRHTIDFGYDLHLAGSSAGRYDVMISIEEETEEP